MAAVGKALAAALDRRDELPPPESHGALDTRRQLHRRVLEWHEQRSNPWSQQGEPWAVLLSILCGRHGSGDDLARIALAQCPGPASIDGKSKRALTVRLGNDSRAREIAQRIKDAARAVQLHGWSLADVARAAELGVSESDWLAAVGLEERSLMPTTGALRVADRLLGSESSTRSESRLNLAKVVTSATDPLAVNIALANLARAICRPRSPRCGDCPANELCDSSEVTVSVTQPQAA